MKATTILKLTCKGLLISLMMFGFALPLQAQEQVGDYAEPYDQYSREELAQMLAPIALYPDTLLSQILMASTYPIEVIEADRWVKKRPGLKDEALDDALLDKSWDPSVKALCHFPSILALMSERISETTDLGNAFLAQEEEVLDMIQVLRAAARAQGTLATSSQQKVIVDRDTIIIEPANPRVIYVPYYDPYYVYGSWWYPAYPPYFWGPPGVSFGIGFSYWPGFYFGFSFGNWCYFDWHYRYVYIDVYKRPRYVRHDHWVSYPGRWYHSPTHRRGVAYRDQYTARKFGQRPYPQREYRDETRGFPEREGRTLRSSDRHRTGRVGTEPTRTPVTAPTVDRDRQDRLRDQQVAPAKPLQPRVERKRTLQSSSSERQRMEKELQLRQRATRQDQERSRVIEPPKQTPAVEPVRREREQQRIERQLKVKPQQRIEQQQRIEKQQRIERQLKAQPQQRVEPQQRIEPQQRVKPQQRIEQQQRIKPQQRIEQGRPSRPSVKDKIQERENVFERVDDGNKARTESERGRSSRQGRSDGPANPRRPWSKPRTDQ